MLYVYDEPVSATKVTAKTNRDFFVTVREAIGPRARFSIVLVGGSDARSIALRRAQSVVRFDRRPSKWSHAALVVRWGTSKAIGESVGLEVSLDVDRDVPQVPERNGVTRFALEKYFDDVRFPNVCVISWTPREEKDAKALATIIERLGLVASNPVANLPRYPLWDWLARWSTYAMVPESSPNPLVEGVPIPSAAFCEYVFDGAGIDLTPGATANDIAPDHLWATVERFSESNASIALAAHALVRDPHATPRPALSAKLDLDRL